MPRDRFRPEPLARSPPRRAPESSAHPPRPVRRRQAAEVQRLLGLGATEVDWAQRPPDADYVILADPEGNRFCVIDTRRGGELRPGGAAGPPFPGSYSSPLQGRTGWGSLRPLLALTLPTPTPRMPSRAAQRVLEQVVDLPVDAAQLVARPAFEGVEHLRDRGAAGIAFARARCVLAVQRADVDDRVVGWSLVSTVSRFDTIVALRSSSS